MKRTILAASLCGVATTAIWLACVVVLDEGVDAWGPEQAWTAVLFGAPLAALLGILAGAWAGRAKRATVAVRVAVAGALLAGLAAVLVRW